MNPQDVLELIQAAQRWNKANRDLLEAYERRTKPPALVEAEEDARRLLNRAVSKMGEPRGFDFVPGDWATSPAAPSLLETVLRELSAQFEHDDLLVRFNCDEKPCTLLRYDGDSQVLATGDTLESAVLAALTVAIEDVQREHSEHLGKVSASSARAVKLAALSDGVRKAGAK